MQCKNQWNISLPFANTIHDMVLGKGALPWWARWFEGNIVVAYKKGTPNLFWIKNKSFMGMNFKKDTIQIWHVLGNNNEQVPS
jgi:hypothetical protein